MARLDNNLIENAIRPMSIEIDGELYRTLTLLTTDYPDEHRFLSFVFSLICANPCHLWFNVPFNFISIS